MPGDRWDEISRISSAVARHFHVLQRDICGPSRRSELILPRHVAMYLARERLGVSYSTIGRYFGGRDHSTVLSAIRKVKALLASNPDFGKEVDDIQDLVAHSDMTAAPPDAKRFNDGGSALSAYAVKDGDRIVSIHLDRGPAEQQAMRADNNTIQRVVEIWVREKAER